ncbi:unnamed protein product, partial [Ectocarpus sp. 12 AP-2014]
MKVDSARDLLAGAAAAATASGGQSFRDAPPVSIASDGAMTGATGSAATNSWGDGGDRGRAGGGAERSGPSPSFLDGTGVPASAATTRSPTEDGEMGQRGPHGPGGGTGDRSEGREGGWRG